MKNIAIIGAGQLGSRHLQAMAKVEDEITLYIVDPSENALQISKERFKEVNTLGKDLICLNRIADLPKELEFVVISTNSKQRLEVLKDLMFQAKVKFLLLEKFLFPTVQEFKQATQILEATNTHAYVNCARRMWPAYQKLKSFLDTSTKVTLEVTGVNWNLASNSIHFLNLFLYLMNETNAILDTGMLDNELLKNKRLGYIEISGTLKAVTPKQHKLILTSKKVGNEPIVISIKSLTQHIEIHEAEQVIFINGEKQEFKMHFQSNLTDKIYGQLQEVGECSLVSYKESAKEHLMLLEAFNEFLGDREGAIT